MKFRIRSSLAIVSLATLITVFEYTKVGLLRTTVTVQNSDLIKSVLVIMPGNLKHTHGICNRYLRLQAYLADRGIRMDIIDSTDADISVSGWHDMMPENTLSFYLPKSYIRYYRAGMYDAVHIAELVSLQSIAAAMTFAYYKIPYTMMCHINYEIYNRQYGDLIPDYLHGIIARFATSRACGVFAPTKGIADQLRNKYMLYNRKLVVLPNSINENLFNPTPNPQHAKVNEYLEKTLCLKRPYLLCVSRIAPEKNLEEFFEMPYPGSKIMVGTGPLLEEYKQKYGDQVTFVGLKKGEELVAYYQNADVFVFPSYSETFGIVMIEAMACGTPISAHPCMGPIDVVDEGITGCLRDNLAEATEAALKLDRSVVVKGAKSGRQRLRCQHSCQILHIFPITKRRF